MCIHLPYSHKPPRLRPRIFCLLLVLFIVLPPLWVSADIGPKPKASFHFVWEIEDQLAIVEGILLQCKDAQCADSYAMEDIGPQHFTCSESACDSLAYGYTQYAKLVVTFSDGVTRESNIFGKKYDVSQYEVTVYSSDLNVIEKRGTNQTYVTPNTTSPIFRLLGILLGLMALVVLLFIIVFTVLKTKDKSLEYSTTKLSFLSTWIMTFPALILGCIFAQSLPLTIIIEGIIISIYTLIKKYRWFPWITVITLGNLFTQIFILTALSVAGFWGPSLIFSIVFEIIVWLIEALLIHLMLRRQKSIPPSLGISLMINIVSMAIGLLLPL